MRLIVGVIVGDLHLIFHDLLAYSTIDETISFAEVLSQVVVLVPSESPLAHDLTFWLLPMFLR